MSNNVKPSSTYLRQLISLALSKQRQRWELERQRLLDENHSLRNKYQSVHRILQRTNAKLLQTYPIVRQVDVLDQHPFPLLTGNSPNENKQKAHESINQVYNQLCTIQVQISSLIALQMYLQQYLEAIVVQHFHSLGLAGLATTNGEADRMNFNYHTTVENAVSQVERFHQNLQQLFQQLCRKIPTMEEVTESEPPSYNVKGHVITEQGRMTTQDTIQLPVALNPNQSETIKALSHLQDQITHFNTNYHYTNLGATTTSKQPHTQMGRHIHSHPSTVSKHTFSHPLRYLTQQHLPPRGVTGDHDIGPFQRDKEGEYREIQRALRSAIEKIETITMHILYYWSTFRSYELTLIPLDNPSYLLANHGHQSNYEFFTISTAIVDLFGIIDQHLSTLLVTIARLSPSWNHFMLAKLCTFIDSLITRKFIVLPDTSKPHSLAVDETTVESLSPLTGDRSEKDQIHVPDVMAALVFNTNYIVDDCNMDAASTSSLQGINVLADADMSHQSRDGINGYEESQQRSTAGLHLKQYPWIYPQQSIPAPPSAHRLGWFVELFEQCVSIALRNHIKQQSQAHNQRKHRLPAIQIYHGQGSINVAKKVDRLTINTTIPVDNDTEKQRAGEWRGGSKPTMGDIVLDPMLLQQLHLALTTRTPQTVNTAHSYGGVDDCEMSRILGGDEYPGHQRKRTYAGWMQPYPSRGGQHNRTPESYERFWKTNALKILIKLIHASTSTFDITQHIIASPYVIRPRSDVTYYLDPIFTHACIRSLTTLVHEFQITSNNPAIAIQITTLGQRLMSAEALEGVVTDTSTFHKLVTQYGMEPKFDSLYEWYKKIKTQDHP